MLVEIHRIQYSHFWLQQYKRKRTEPTINSVLALTKTFCSRATSSSYLTVVDC